MAGFSSRFCGPDGCGSGCGAGAGMSAGGTGSASGFGGGWRLCFGCLARGGCAGGAIGSPSPRMPGAGPTSTGGPRFVAGPADGCAGAGLLAPRPCGAGAGGGAPRLGWLGLGRLAAREIHRATARPGFCSSGESTSGGLGGRLSMDGSTGSSGCDGAARLAGGRALGRRRRGVGRRRAIDLGRGVRRRGRDFLAADAILQPDVIDRMLHAMEAGAGREHPAGENPLASCRSRRRRPGRSHRSAAFRSGDG